MVRVRVRGALAACAISLIAAGCTPATTGRQPAEGSTSSTTSVSAASSPVRTATSPSVARTSATAHARHVPAPPSTSSSSTPPAQLPNPAAGSQPVVVINPGHNGGNAAHAAEISRSVYAGFGMYKACDTTGTETDAGYPEHAFNWDVSQRVAAILRAHHVRVVFTRTDDTGVGPCVNDRAAIGNHPWVAAVVSIHADGAPASGHGFHVNLDSRRPEGATAETVAASKRLADEIHSALVSSSGLVPSTYIGSDGYYYRSDLAGLNLASRPATFLELGNMRNAHDASLESSAAGRARIATAVAVGILTYLSR